MLSRFVAAVTVVGLFVITQSVAQLGEVPRMPEWLLLGILAVACGSFVLSVPGVPVHASISDTFLFTSVMLFGPAPATAAIAIDGFLLSWRRGHPTERILFNTANPALGLWVGAQTFMLLVQRGPGGAPLTSVEAVALPLAAMAGLHFLVNSGLTAIAAALERGVSPLEVWRRHFAVFSLSHAASASAGLFLLVLAQRLGVVALAAVMPMVAIVYLGLRSRFGRLADAERHVRQVDRLYMSTIQALSTAIEAKDGVTSSHIRRVQTYSLALARALGVNEPDALKAIEAASLLHDTGKLAVPEHILNKPGKLTPAEFEAMKLHVDVGADILSSIDFPYPVVPIVRAHHENWDGSGYPRGLQGDDIPIGARILSVVDCYDALTSDRPYRPAMTTTQALAIVMERRGSMYDPRVVDAFIELLPSLRAEGVAEPELQRAVTRIRDAAVTEPAPMPAAGLDTHPMSAVSVVDSLARVVGGAPRVADLARLIVPELRLHSPGAEFIVYLASATGQRIVARATSGAPVHGAHDMSIVVGERISGWVAANRQQVVNSDARLDLGPLAQSAALQYCVATPLVDGDRVVGVLTGYATAPFSDDAARQLATLAPRLAPVLAMAADAEDAAPRPSRPALRAGRADLRVAVSN
ncbi:MAG: HD domain-containing phosphohydrolase [Vicinamibacterales bacterium]